MRAVVDPKDRQFLSRLHRMGESTIQEICAEIGVTATAIRQRLTRLEAVGLVLRETVRAGRGRPHFVYRPTEDGLRELGENYAGLAVGLWNSVQKIEDVAVRQAVLVNVRLELVERFGGSVVGKSYRERVLSLGRQLAESGFDVEVDTSGDLPILRENNCPYLDLANVDSEICELEHSVFEEILGIPLELSRCSQDGSGCCEFHARREAS